MNFGDRSPGRQKIGKSSSDAWTMPHIEAGVGTFTIATLRLHIKGVAHTPTARLQL